MVISLLSLVALMPRPSFDRQVLYSCGDVVKASEVHSAGPDIPCKVEEGEMWYGRASEPVTGTSYGVVVKGEHWTAT